MSTWSVGEQTLILLFSAQYEHKSFIVINTVISKFTESYLLVVILERLHVIADALLWREMKPTALIKFKKLSVLSVSGNKISEGSEIHQIIRYEIN